MYSFTFDYKCHPRQCTYTRYGNKLLTIIFDDVEINSTLGSGLELFKLNGRLNLVTHIREEHQDFLRDVIEAIETRLGKPLLWLLDEPKNYKPR